MSVDARDDRWAYINPSQHEQSLVIVRDILRDFEDRLSGIDVNGTGLVIPDDFITAAMIAAGAVGSSEIAADAVTASEIAAGAVGTDELANNAVTAAKILDGTLTAAEFATVAANLGLFGPTSGAAATPSFRAIVAADLPLATVRVATTTPVTVTTAECAADAVIVVRLAAPGAVAVAIPAPGTAGRRVTIKDGTGDATANNITTTPASGTIDGAATNVINADWGARTYVDNGTEWNNL